MGRLLYMDIQSYLVPVQKTGGLIPALSTESEHNLSPPLSVSFSLSFLCPGSRRRAKEKTA